jgi:hypothetical protein
MALDPSNGYVAARNLQDLNENALPIFNVERVQLQFSIASDFVAAQVANNVLVLALSNGRILRIDLDNPADIDGTGPPSLQDLLLTNDQTLTFQRRRQKSV